MKISTPGRLLGSAALCKAVRRLHVIAEPRALSAKHPQYVRPSCLCHITYETERKERTTRKRKKNFVRITAATAPDWLSGCAGTVPASYVTGYFWFPAKAPFRKVSFLFSSSLPFP